MQAENSEGQTQTAVFSQDLQATEAVSGTALAETASVANLAATQEARSTQLTLDLQATSANAAIARTSTAQPMLDRLSQLRDYGYLSRISGHHESLPNFTDSWAQIDWYTWTETGFSPADFVIRAHASWSSASDRANWFNSGCGFVFRAKNESNHYMAFLGLDGRVYLLRWRNNIYADLGSSYYGPVEVPSGDAEIMLVADGPDIRFFVNDELVHYRQDRSMISGDLGLTLVSGTNKDYGTRCRMTEIELWVLD